MRIERSAEYTLGCAVCIVVLLGAFLSIAPSAAAVDAVIVKTPSGKPLFQYNILNPGDQGVEFDGDIVVSDWYLDSAQRRALIDGGNYWAMVLGPGARNRDPLPIVVNTAAGVDNMGAISPVPPASGDSMLGAGLMRNETGAYPSSNYARVQIGDYLVDGGYDLAPVSVLPQNGLQISLGINMLHELGHALGINADSQGVGDWPSWQFGNRLSTFASHLYDQRGNPAKPGGIIHWDAGAAGPDDFLVEPDSFAWRNFGETWGGRLFFRGDNVDEVLNGAILDSAGLQAGIPVNGWEMNADNVSVPEFSHIELRNSLMRHQYYRNYGVFMEAELAVMQDLGYDLDRRNFFGSSIYNSGLTLDNDKGYFARNAAGTGYIAGQPNLTPFGIGLHIYGDNNTISQRADLLADGRGAVGIRVDGWRNTLTVAPGVRVTANGEGGTGLMVAYGRNHIINSLGDIIATGRDGIAARFDFGNNTMGNWAEYRGSGIWGYFDTDGNWYGWDASNLVETYGSLVSEFNVSGRLAGAGAAVYISRNAYVAEINFLNGASLSGDIVSDWDAASELIDPSIPITLVTSLTFGRAANPDGTPASAGGDDNFSLVYDGNISGAKSMLLAVRGGSLVFNGQADVLGVQNDAGASLGGNGVYTVGSLPGVADTGLFISGGRLAPGGPSGLGIMQINMLDSVNGAFIHDGTLGIRFTASGETDRLVINGGNPALGGISGYLELTPVAGYYAPGHSLALDIGQIITGDGVPTIGGYTANAVSSPPFSPTLGLNLSVPVANLFDISFNRAANAYSRFAASAEGREVGLALDSLGGIPLQGPIRDLFAALDFSRIDGADIRSGLEALEPRLYGVSSQAVLDMQRRYSSVLLAQLLSASSLIDPLAAADGSDQALACRSTVGGGWYAFALPFGGASTQRTGERMQGYDTWEAGFVGGVEKRSHERVVGLHLAYGHMKMDGRGALRDRYRDDGVFVGGHGRFVPTAWNGGHVYGLARIGADNARQTRTVAVANHVWQNEASWTGVAGSALFGAGYDFAIGRARLGPLAELDYAGLWRPSVTEDAGPSALRAASRGYNSLRSGLGARLACLATRKVSLDLSARWYHEFLDLVGTTTANFAGYDAYSFAYRTERPGRDSLGLSAAMRTAMTQRVDVALSGGGEFFRAGYSSWWVNAGIGLGF